MKNYYQLIDELINITDKCLVDHPEPKEEKEALLLYAIAKADKTLSAIVLLCKNGMGEDASILSRSLFELALMVEYILNDESDYRIKRFSSYDWVQRKKMYEYMKTSTLAEELNKPENIKIIKDIKKHAEEAQLKYKYKNTTWSDKNIYETADYLSKLNLYNTVYKLQCNFSHSNPRAMNNYFKIEKDQLVLDSGPSDSLIKETLVITFISCHELLVQFNKYFEKGVEEELKILEDEFVEDFGLNT